MPTSFELSHLLLISILYLLTLFGVAWVTEKACSRVRSCTTLRSIPCRWAFTPAPGPSMARLASLTSMAMAF